MVYTHDGVTKWLKVIILRNMQRSNPLNPGHLGPHFITVQQDKHLDSTSILMWTKELNMLIQRMYINIPVNVRQCMAYEAIWHTILFLYCV